VRTERAKGQIDATGGRPGRRSGAVAELSRLLLLAAALAVAAAGAGASPQAGADPFPAAAGEPAASASGEEAAPLPAPDRSRELLDYRCANDLGVRQVTLFANGTVRLREGLGQRPRMSLAEIGPRELEGYLRRLQAEDLSEVDDRRESAEGAWVERCTLLVALDGRPARRLTFSRFDSLPLAVGTLVRLADELAARTLAVSDLQPSYQPRVGDVLRRGDGVLFEVAGFTSDGQGLELRGVEQPLTLYLRPGDLQGQFVSLVSRRMP
jgi:hypothetical protein